MNKNFDEFMSSLTPEVWTDIYNEYSDKREDFRAINFDVNTDPEKVSLRMMPGLTTVLILRRYHEWLSN